jgi:hypothetical protein
MGFTHITVRDTASFIRSQWGERIQTFKVLDLLLNLHGINWAGLGKLEYKDFEQGN